MSNTLTNEKGTEICCQCGKPCHFGSGRFVNRVPNCDTVAERKENGHEFPEGDYHCGLCEAEYEAETAPFRDKNGDFIEGE